MNEIPVHNSGKETMYLAGIAIQSGETRFIDEVLVPASLRGGAASSPSVADVPPPDPIEALLDATAKNIKFGVTARGETGAPVITDEQLAAMKTREEARDKPRKGVLEVLTAELLTRAAERASAAGHGSDAD